MYGVIGSAVIFGIILTQVIKRMEIKSIDKQDLVFVDKDFMPKRYIFGGIIFGLGWALTGGLSGANVCLVGRRVLCHYHSHSFRHIRDFGLRCDQR